MITNFLQNQFLVTNNIKGKKILITYHIHYCFNLITLCLNEFALYARVFHFVLSESDTGIMIVLNDISLSELFSCGGLSFHFGHDF